MISKMSEMLFLF